MKHPSFCPPKTNPLLVSLFKAALPLIFKTVLGGLEVSIDPESLTRLKALRGERMLLLPNHPTSDDPFVPFALSKALGETFNFVAAREAFDWNYGLRGWLFQHTGVYSVIRGAPDRESFKMTRELLVQGLRRLVIFIEGEVSNENDTLIPFEPGVIQLAFWAQEDLIKQAGVVPENPPGLYLAPMAIKYLYHPGAERAVEHALAGLETEVGLPHSADAWYERLLKIAQKLLSYQETRMNLKPAPEDTLNSRVAAFKEKLLGKIELFLDITPAKNAEYLERIRAVRNRMDKVIHTYQGPEHLSPYEYRMLHHLRGEFHEFYDELERLVNFLILREGYIRESETQERYIHVIRRLEREVYGEPQLLYPRTAVVKIGNILNLKDYYPVYEQDKRQTVKGIAMELEANMMQVLQGIRPGKI